MSLLKKSMFVSFAILSFSCSNAKVIKKGNNKETVSIYPKVSKEMALALAGGMGTDPTISDYKIKISGCDSGYEKTLSMADLTTNDADGDGTIDATEAANDPVIPFTLFIGDKNCKDDLQYFVIRTGDNSPDDPYQYTTFRGTLYDSTSGSVLNEGADYLTANGNYGRRVFYNSQLLNADSEIFSTPSGSSSISYFIKNMTSGANKDLVTTVDVSQTVVYGTAPAFTLSKAEVTGFSLGFATVEYSYECNTEVMASNMCGDIDLTNIASVDTKLGYKVSVIEGTPSVAELNEAFTSNSKFKDIAAPVVYTFIPADGTFKGGFKISVDEDFMFYDVTARYVFLVGQNGMLYNKVYNYPTP